jgi:hypothetical protein
MTALVTPAPAGSCGNHCSRPSPSTPAGVAALGLLAAIACCGCGSSPAAPAVSPQAGAEGAAPAPLRARLRRLSNAEYAETLSRLVGFRVELPASFPPDVLEHGFSANGRQGVDATYAGEAQKLARTLAARAARSPSGELVRCSPQQPGCAEEFVAAFERRAYRRTPRAEEVAAGLALFESAAKSGGFAAGVEQVVATLAVSPSLLYVSELGEPKASGSRELSSEEAAGVLAYMLTGGPPDEELMAAATRGELLAPAPRVAAARRLLGQSATRYQFRRFVREWLGLDALATLAKPVADDQNLRLGLLAETDAFVDEVFMYEGASLDRLLIADFTVVPASLRSFEGLPPAPAGEAYGRVSLSGSARLGLLQQPSFLAVFSHESSTAPVLRGKAVLERFLCVELPRPTELGLLVTFPPPNPGLTTRERHARHTEDPTCRGCHRSIDALGFTFENFDFVGRVRSEENQRPIDTRTDYGGAEGPRRFEDSRDVARWLAESPRAHDCFARQAFRFFTGHHDAAAEAAFMLERRRLPAERQRDLFEMLVAYVGSSWFMQRAEAQAP